MKLYRIMALIERDMRKFFRSPALMMASMIFPLVQLVVLGYAFGGKIKGRNASRWWIRTIPSNRGEFSEMFNGIAAGPQTFRVIDYDSQERRARRSARRIRARRRRDSRRFFAPLLPARPPAHRSSRGQHRPIRLQLDRRAHSGDGERTERAVRGAAAGSGRATQRRRSVSLRRIHQISARRLDCHVHFHRGDDRRRHHLHRRQIARPARRLSADAHSQNGAGPGPDRCGHDQRP